MYFLSNQLKIRVMKRVLFLCFLSLSFFSCEEETYCWECIDFYGNEYDNPKYELCDKTETEIKIYSSDRSKTNVVNGKNLSPLVICNKKK
jgi:hypothetical protein